MIIDAKILPHFIDAARTHINNSEAGYRAAPLFTTHDGPGRSTLQSFSNFCRDESMTKLVIGGESLTRKWHHRCCDALMVNYRLAREERVVIFHYYELNALFDADQSVDALHDRPRTRGVTSRLRPLKMPLRLAGDAINYYLRVSESCPI